MAVRELAIQFSLKLALFPLHMAMRILFGMFLFAFSLISTQKCEPVNFSSSWLPCLHASPISKFWHVIINTDDTIPTRNG